MAERRRPISGSRTRPQAKRCYGRVLRGGGWFDQHWSCRASVRRRGHPNFQVDDVGFRVARSVLR
ncbi:SUMF1/EgtB/PvdO family nonheme iron enzyme [Frankia sp. CiP1_Cm_nod1]|uniref:SUMF1/EgtB/PvdO family nonheme iron enzyme n=1 Tax=Frankia sp. CiP1_Cm_nod1 TaxID=2897160 RepID=UPI004044AD42